MGAYLNILVIEKNSCLDSKKNQKLLHIFNIDFTYSNLEFFVTDSGLL